MKIKYLHLFWMIVGAMILFSGLVLAQEHSFDEAKAVIESKISCSQLTDGHFELLGDYFMEQMHPGELHEVMDERMGGEGSVQLRNVHIAMGKSFYCADNSMMTMPMMSMMMGRSGGMMGNYHYSYSNFNLTFLLLNILLVVLITAGIVWITKLLKKEDNTAEMLKGRHAKGKLKR